ncbi:MAG: universal stress protein [Armatimonadetes bacterium]|nr:universal stress protein [Armatimonadota bacterium]
MIIEAREDTITLRGEIKSNIWPAIQAAAALLLEKHPTGIIIDCSGLTNITAKGAETFADALGYITSHNARIIVASLAPELLEIGKSVPAVRAQLPMASTVEEARRALSLVEVAPQRGKARLAGVAPIVGNWRRAVYFADKLAVGENCEIHLVDLIKVPRTLPVGTPMPEREAAGLARLEEAKSLVRETGLKCFTHVERVRSESVGLVEFVHRLEADFAVASIERGKMGEPHIEEPEAMMLLEEADFEVSVINGGPTEANRPVTQAVVPAVGAWDHAVEHACKLVSGPNALVTVVYLIAIPRTQPIDAAMPDAEAAASDCAKEALRIAKRYPVKVNPRTERVRDPIRGFLRFVDSNAFDLAVVGVKGETTSDYHIAHTIATELLQELPCETVFLRVQ